MSERLRVLFIEDSENDVILTLRELRRGGYEIAHRRVQTADELRTALEDEAWDIILSDYAMPNFSAPEALEIVKAFDPDLPFIVISGTIGEATAVEVLKAGADDFMLKNFYPRLLPAIRRELDDAATRRDKRKAEAALRREEERFRRIVETALEGIWMFDTQGSTTYLNRRMADLLGTTVDRVLGTPFQDYVDRAHLDAVSRRIFSGENVRPDPGRFACRFRRADGAAFWGSVVVSRITAAPESERGFLALVADVTEERELHEKLERAYDDLQVVDRLKMAILENVSHELNTPIAIIKGSLEVLQGGPTDTLSPQMQKQIIEMFQHNIDRLAFIVENLLQISSLRFKADSLTVAAIDARELVEEAVARLRDQFTVAGIGVRTEHEPEKVVLEADARRLRLVLINLLSNALKFLKRGDEVVVRARRTPDGGFAIAVVDNGPGIPPEKIDSLTGLFTQADSSRTKRYSGLGIGLATSKAIMEKHGGALGIENNPGGGMTVTMRLPPAAVAGKG